jgi:peptidoglycan/LPS O-acetylase OafA/YrhL
MSEARFINPTSRLPELDGIRGVAIGLILIWHYFAIRVPINPDSRLFQFVFYLRQSWCGVDLFFVLSGFLIGGILIDARESKHFFRTFYLRRAFRILPLYFLVLISFSVGAYLTERGWGASVKYAFDQNGPIWSYWFLVQNIWSAATGQWGSHWLGVTWSLAIEEQFYITLPLLVRYTSTRLLPWVVLALVGLAPILRTILYYHYQFGQFSGYWLMPCRTDALGLGVLLAVLIRSAHGWRTLINNKWIVVVSLCASCAGFVWLDIHGCGVGTEPMATYGHSVLAVFFASLIAWMLIVPTGSLCRIMRFKPLGFLGIIAYGVYLLHYPILVLVQGSGLFKPTNADTWDGVLITMLALGLTILFSTLSWTLVEKRLLSVAHRFKY